MISHGATERPGVHTDEEKMAPSNSSTLSPEFQPDQPLTAPEYGNTKDVLEKQAEAVLVKPNVHDMSSVPNGGLGAWLQVLGGFFILFNTW
jgi:hypothetical protein